MSRKTKKQRRAERLWWRRSPWPAVVLAADPGRKAGAAVFVRDEVVDIFEVDIFTRDLEEIVELAGDIARHRELPLVLALEEWGRGGPLGIDQWIGLGEARGAWRRAFVLYCNEHDDTRGRIALFSKSRIITISQQRWRSVVVPETGFVHPVMGWRAFTPDEWKDAAARAFASRYNIRVDDKPNGAEAGCIGIYAMRSDELGKILPPTFLAQFGLTYPPPMPGPRPRMKKRSPIA